MGKTKTSKKRNHFSGTEMPTVKIKTGVKLSHHDPDKNLKDQDFIAKALFQCLIDGDTKGFKEILQAHLEAINISELAEKAGVGRRTIYEALSPKGNPSLNTLTKILHLTIKAAS